jgi:hypothetical protein
LTMDHSARVEREPDLLERDISRLLNSAAFSGALSGAPGVSGPDDQFAMALARRAGAAIPPDRVFPVPALWASAGGLAGLLALGLRTPAPMGGVWAALTLAPAVNLLAAPIVVLAVILRRRVFRAR